MKKIILMILFLSLFSLSSFGGQIVFDVPDNPPWGYYYTKDGEPQESIIYKVGATEIGQRVLGPTFDDTAGGVNYEFWSINEQGRRSANSTPFTLSPPPDNPPTGVSVTSTMEKSKSK